MREKPIRSGIARQARPTRRLANNSAQKKPLEAATCPEGNE